MGLTFTTRPELHGTFGMVSSTHWLGSAAGMAMLESGGNAFDAAVAAGLTLQVVEPNLHGPGGEVPIVFAPAGSQGPRVLSGQGPAPGRASPRHFASLGLDMVPGTGLLAAPVPGAFDAWMLLLRDYGTKRLGEVLEHAIGYAERGFPLLAWTVRRITEMEDTFRQRWPASAALYLRRDGVPKPHTLHRNPALARTLRRLLAEGAAAGAGREAQIEAARRAWSAGFVAEEIDAFARRPHWDGGDEPHAGLITAADMEAYRAAYEEPVRLAWRDWTVCKTGPWGQGPVFLQQLALLDGCQDARRPFGSAPFIHALVEAAKLAYADRDAFYGDVADVPLDALLSPAYTEERRGLMAEVASHELRPGSPGERRPRLPAFMRAATEGAAVGAAGVGAAPVLSDADVMRNNTCHVATVDRDGNMLAATPSGGIFMSSPVIESLGFPLSTRLEMAWLEEGLPNTLAPGKRPRTTLSPTLALRDGVPALAFGSPGADQQEQWSLQFLLAVDGGNGLQRAIDRPKWHTDHLADSLYPHEIHLGRLVLESPVRDSVARELRDRGHDLVTVPEWWLSRLCAVGRDPATGVLAAAADPRAGQAYACGR